MVICQGILQQRDHEKRLIRSGSRLLQKQHCGSLPVCISDPRLIAHVISCRQKSRFFDYTSVTVRHRGAKAKQLLPADHNKDTPSTRATLGTHALYAKPCQVLSKPKCDYLSNSFADQDILLIARAGIAGLAMAAALRNVGSIEKPYTKLSELYLDTNLLSQVEIPCRVFERESKAV